MPIRISGLASGLDTESIVGALVSAYSYKKDKYVKSQTKLSWKQDAWKSLNSKVYSLYKSVGTMRYDSSYSIKKAVASDSTKATCTATGSAVIGTQTLSISKLATTGYLTGGKLSSSVTASSTIASLGDIDFTEEVTDDEGNTKTKDVTGKINVTANGKTTSIEVNKSTTISEFVSKLNETGIQASFDENNHRIFVSSKETGADNDFTLSPGDSLGLKSLSLMGLLTSDYGSDAETVKPYAKFDENGNYDSEATATDLKTRIFTIHNAYVELQTPKYTGDDLTEAQQLHNELYDKYYPIVNEVEGSEDSYEGALISYVESVMGSGFDWIQADAESVYEAVYSKIDITLGTDTSGVDISNDPKATKIAGADASIVLNGETYTSSTNSITVNGLTVECLATTTDQITVTTSNDTDALYDKVKDFLSSYNSLMNEMQKLYNADSAKDYEPLTDDEKAEMSETEIEKWEQKIKDSLLRRDSSLSSIISTMTLSMMKQYEVNGETVAWSTFGVHTLGTLNAEKNEGYAYHIDGDTEDSYTSGNEEKLRAALAEDPDKVIAFLKQVTSGLYSAMDEKMKSTSVKSVYTVYNDKEMASEYSNYSDLIKQWTERVTDMEDAYYKKFAAMEKALATLQSNSSSLSSLLGG